MAQTTYATMFVWAVLTLFGTKGKKKEVHNLSLLDLPASPKGKIISTRVVGYSNKGELKHNVEELAMEDRHTSRTSLELEDSRGTVSLRR